MPRRQLASDAFTASISANWTNGDGDYDPLSWISNGVVRASLVGNDCAMRRTGEAYPNDQWSQITVAVLSDSSGIYRDQSAGVRLKSGSDESGYWGSVACITSGGVGKYQIAEVNASFGFTTLAQAGTASGTAIPAGTKITLEIIGSTITLYTNEGGTDTSRVSTTDSTITSGAPGVKIYVDANAGQLANSSISAWAGGDFQSNTLTAAQGSYSLTGQTANLVTPRTIAAGQGSYSLSGQTATLKRGASLSAVAGSYTLTGSTAEADFSMPAEFGSYSLSGQAAALRAARKMAAAQGSYSLTGEAAAFVRGRTLAAAQGAYTLTGEASRLAAGFRLTCAAGAYSLDGQSAGLLFSASNLIQADFGEYLLSGQTVQLRATHISLSAQHADYTLTGRAANLVASRRMLGAAGSYALNGQDATLTKFGTFDLQGDAGSYALNGTAAELRASRLLMLDSGSYALTGSNGTLAFGARLSCANGSYFLSGQRVTLSSSGAVILPPPAKASLRVTPRIRSSRTT